MSQFVELANTLQQQQIDLVKQSQQAFLKSIETLVANAQSAQSAAGKVEVPEEISEALKPSTEFFGTPDEVQNFLAESTKTWTKLGQDFQNAVVAQLTKKA